MPDGQLLMPAAQAARKMGMSRRTLKRRIDAKEIKAVKVGPRLYIPQSEINRIVNGEPAQISTPKPATANQVSGDGAEWGQTLPDAAKSPKERLDEILEGYVDFLRRVEAGDPDAAVAAVGSPEECARAKEAYAHAIEVWKEYRE